MSIVLDAVNKKLEIVLAGVVAANQLPFVASYADYDDAAPGFTPGENDGLTNNAVVVTLVAAPGAGEQRLVNNVSIYNKDTAAATVTIQYDNAGVDREIVKVTLAVGYSLHFREDQWQVLDTNGAMRMVFDAGVSFQHDILSNTHGDADVDAVTRGSLVYGNATPKWDELVIGGAAEFLKSDGMDASWAAVDFDDLSGDCDLADLAGYARGSIIRGGAADWEAHAAETNHFILVGDGVDVLSKAFDWDDMAVGAGADMVHDHSAAGEGGEIPLASLGACIWGRMIIGGAANWTTLGHPGFAGYALISNVNTLIWNNTPSWGGLHTFSAGAAIAAGQGLAMGDASWLGIVGNELLTVNAAGNFTFSGVTSIVVPDGAWVGADANASWMYDATSGDVTTLDKVGVGTRTPGNLVHVYSATTGVIEIEGFADNAYLYLNSATDAGASEESGIFFQHNSVNRFQLASTGTAAAATFFIYDFGRAATQFSLVGNGDLTLMGGGGDVGVGVAPAFRLDVLDDTAGGFVANFFNDGDNINRYVLSLQGGADNGAAAGVTYYIYAKDGNGDVTGYIYTLNGVFTFADASDEARKTNIEDTKVVGLDIINGLKVRDYNWKKNPAGPMMTSFVAQEALKVYPTMISEALDGTLMTSRTTLIPIMVKAIQEQQVQIEQLQKQREEWKNESRHIS